MPNETVVNPGVGRPFALNRSSQIFIRQYGGILAGLLAVIIIFTLLSPKFLSVNNMTNILLQVSITAIAAFGMTFVLLLGDVDLSAGSTLALVGTVSALLVNNGIPILSSCLWPFSPEFSLAQRTGSCRRYLGCRHLWLPLRP